MAGGRPSLPPLQNRVLPTQEIVSDPARGMFTGNRGNLQFTDRKLGTPRWKHQHWIICDLVHPRGRYHGPMPARAWTPLFFLDEAVGLAAGHRPCAYCRPQAYAAFKSAWAKALGPAGHKEMDRALHAARVTRNRKQIRFQAQVDSLPTGTFFLWEGRPTLCGYRGFFTYTPNGYSALLTQIRGEVTVLTPQPNLAVLSAGFRPCFHDSAAQHIR